MRGISLTALLGFLGVIYAIGLAIHFWYIIVAGVVVLVVLEVRKSNPRPLRPMSAMRSKPQAHYSNRR
jgi:hypothetical protein